MNLMCLEYYPECGDGGDGCCERSLEIALIYVRGAFGNRKSIPSRSVVPPIHVRRVDFQLYAVWCDKSGNRVASCIEACCRVCAKADFISAHVWDEGLAAPSLAQPRSGKEPLEDLSSSPPLKKLNQRSPKRPLKIPGRRARALNQLNRLYSAHSTTERRTDDASGVTWNSI